MCFACCLFVLETLAILHLYCVEVCPFVTPRVVMWLRKCHQRLLTSWWVASGWFFSCTVPLKPIPFRFYLTQLKTNNIDSLLASSYWWITKQQILAEVLREGEPGAVTWWPLPCTACNIQTLNYTLQCHQSFFLFFLTKDCILCTWCDSSMSRFFPESVGWKT